MKHTSVETLMTRALYKSMGFSSEELDGRPIIGIANSWTTLVPGHYNLNQLSEYVKKGIYHGGGTAVEFGVIAACDGIANGHEGMKYILPSREIICSSIEIEARAHRLDALVLLGSCDKILPGMLMAAARLNIPTIIVTGGPMLGGIEFDGRKSDSTSVDEAYGMYRAGRIDDAELSNLEDGVCPGCGSCAFLGTANTMGCITEALGMSLTGSALVPAVYAERLRIAYHSGLKICELAEKRINPLDIITEDSIKNAITATLALCGSTNACLHISAIVYEAGLNLNVMDEFVALGASVPQIAKVNPSAKWDMEDFYKAGGMPRVLSNLGNLINGDCMSCTGKTMKENLGEYKYTFPENTDIIRPIENPFEKSHSLAVLKGNLAPKTCVTKPGAYSKELHVFKGPANVFDCEEDANEAILAGKVKPGDVVVIRYEGPKGGPGMREMYKAMKYLYGMGLAKSTALITDGRFSGTNNGCFVGHISPEAAEGGLIAIVENGDIIEINVPDGKLTLFVNEEEIKNRFAAWKRPEREIPRGYLRTYAKLASSADMGAVLI